MDEETTYKVVPISVGVLRSLLTLAQTWQAARHMGMIGKAYWIAQLVIDPDAAVLIDLAIEDAGRVLMQHD